MIKQNSHIIRTAFGNRQPKLEPVTKKHPNLNKLSVILSKALSMEIYPPNPSGQRISHIDKRAMRASHETPRVRRSNF